MLLMDDPSPHAAGWLYLYTNRYHTRTAIIHSLGKLVESPPPPPRKTFLENKSMIEVQSVKLYILTLLSAMETQTWLCSRS